MATARGEAEAEAAEEEEEESEGETEAPVTAPYKGGDYGSRGRRIATCACLSLDFETFGGNSVRALLRQAANQPSNKLSHGTHAQHLLWGEAGPLGGTHAGGRWGPMARFSDFFARFSTCFHENFAYCDHAITPCDSLSALLTVPCCTIDHLHSSRP